MSKTKITNKIVAEYANAAGLTERAPRSVRDDADLLASLLITVNAMECLAMRGSATVDLGTLAFAHDVRWNEREWLDKDNASGSRMERAKAVTGALGRRLLKMRYLLDTKPGVTIKIQPNASQTVIKSGDNLPPIVRFSLTPYSPLKTLLPNQASGSDWRAERWPFIEVN